MPNSTKPIPTYRFLVLSSLLISLILSTYFILSEPDLIRNWEVLVIGIPLVTLLSVFPIPIGSIEFNLTHSISLPILIAYGPAPALVILLLGFTLAALFRILRAYSGYPSHNRSSTVDTWIFSFTSQTIGVCLAALVLIVTGGEPIQSSSSLLAGNAVLLSGMTFITVLFTLIALFQYALGNQSFKKIENAILLLLIAGPLPFAYVTAIGLVSIGNFILLLYGSAIAIISPIIRNLILTKDDLERRLEELSFLSEVSQAMRTSLELDNLLASIYMQVAHLLQVDCFYVALINKERNNIEYPLAIKDGERVTWADRPTADRLTDRVILLADSILITESSEKTLMEMGLPDTEGAPEAWLGVPLLHSEGSIGCLAVFRTHPGRPFTERDLELLVTLASQAAVSIQNSRLFKLTQDRANDMATLQRVTQDIGSTLELRKIYEITTTGISEVSRAAMVEIYLLDKDGQLQLIETTRTESTDNTKRNYPEGDFDQISEAFFTGLPSVYSPQEDDQFEPAGVSSHKTDSYSSILGLPLITSQGTIGQVLIYYQNQKIVDKDHIDLLMTLVGQAALAIENAQMYAEVDHELNALVDQLSDLKEIGREMSSILDCMDLIDKILATFISIVEAEAGYYGLFNPDEETFDIVQASLKSQKTPVKKEISFPLEEIEISRSNLERGNPITLGSAGLTAFAHYIGGNDPENAIVVPIIERNKIIAAVLLENYSVPYDDELQRFLPQVAAQASSAYSNAAMFQKLEENLREQSLLYQVSLQIAGTLEPESVAFSAVEGIRMVLNAESVVLSRMDDKHEALRVLSYIHREGLSENLESSVSLSNAPALISCVENGRHIQWTLHSAPSGDDLNHLRETRKAQSILILPLIVGGECIGLIEVLSDEIRVFDLNDIRLARTISSQVAIALQNIDLFQKISQSYDRLMSVLNSTKEGMLLTNPSGRIVIGNVKFKEFTQIDTSLIVGKDISDPSLGFKQVLDYSDLEFDEMIKGFDTSHPVLSPSDTIINVEKETSIYDRSETIVRNKEGDLIGWMVILRDITKEKKIEETREQLTDMIVHDLRSPLTTIVNSLSILERSDHEEIEKQILDQAHIVSQRSVDQMLKLVDSLLDLRKLESKDIGLQLESTSMQSLTEEIYSTYLQEANDAGIIFECHCDSDISEQHVDGGKIRRVFMNLLDNAIAFTPAGGRVSLDIRLIDQDLAITVADTGPGIPEDMRERVFDRFFQIPGVRRRRRGTGLGLAFSKLAVEAHDGKIWVEDNDPTGSRFQIRIPHL